MKKKLRLMMTMLLLAVMGSAWAETETIVLSAQEYENAQVVSSTQGNVVTLTYNKGTSTNAPAYYDTGTGVRVYAGGNMTVTANGNTITKVVVTYGKNNSPTISFSSNGTTTSSTADSPATWEGSATDVLFNVTNKGHARIQSVAVTYNTGGGQIIETVATPVFSPAGGTYNEAQNVKISTTTNGATIYYTLNGDDPTTLSSVYSEAITIAETTTIKAIAIKEGMNNSTVASATYTIISGDIESWVETSLADLTEDDVFVIVGNNGANYAMSNDKGTSNPPAAVTVTINGDNLVGIIPDNIKWNVSGNATNGYTFYPNGSTSTWLYCTSTNNGVRVGTNDNKTFKISSEGYLNHVGTSRYVGIYSSQDWRCYESINTNIVGQTFKFYKKPTDGPELANPQLSFSESSVTAEVGVEFTAPTLTYAEGFDGMIVYASSNPDVATVDASTGEVTIVAAGETTISATSEATDNFKAGYASYTLTVEVASHNVTFSANGTTFSTITAKEGANIAFPTENPTDEGDYKFIGWSTEDWIGEKENSPTTLVTSATMGTEDMTIYAVYAITTEGTSVRWKKMAASEVTEEGTYAIITSTEGSNAYYAFNGTITSGHGQTTPNYFTFDTDGYADSAPAGTCELIFEASGEGFKMRTEDLTANGNKPYLCASDASSGNLSWLNSGEYWSYINENWTYNKNFGGKYAYLRQFNNTLRTYGSNNGRPIEFAKKVGGITYSNYCTKINGFEKVTLSTDGYITYVTKNAIDWVQTLARNSQDGVDVHGYKVVDFSLDNGVSMVEYGVENLSTVASTDKMYQEPIIPAGTPIIIQGKQGDNYMVVADEENVTAPAGNLLRASDGIATTTDEVKLFVLQKIDQSGSGINNYTFYRLTKGRQIPVGKAYLSSEDMTLPNPGTPGVDPNNMPAANFIRILVQTDNDSLVSDDAGIIDGIGTVAQDSEDGQVIYNLNGVKVNNPSKGIYVKNGKKVIIK